MKISTIRMEPMARGSHVAEPADTVTDVLAKPTLSETVNTRPKQPRNSVTSGAHQ